MGFPTWVHVPLLQILYQSHLDYYYGTHIISHISETNVCHTLLTVNYQLNSRAIDSRLLDLTYTHSGDVTRSDARKSGAILDLSCLSFHQFRLSVIISFLHNILRTTL